MVRENHLTKLAKSNWRVGLVGLTISGIAVYLAFSRLQLSNLQTDLADVRLIYVPLSFITLILGLVVRAFRWRALLDGEIAIKNSFSVLCMGYLLNSLLPLRAGDLSRIYLGTRLQPPLPALKTTSTIILERVLDLLALVVVLAFTLSGAALPAEVRAAAFAAVPAALGGFVFLVILSRQHTLAEKLLAWLVNRIQLLQRFDVSAWALHFLDGLKPLTAPRKLLSVIIWTGLGWGCTITAGYLLMLAFYDQGNWLTAGLFVGVLALAVAVPAVPGNVGTYEMAIITVLQATGYGEPANKALVFAVLLHAIDVLAYVLTGLAGFFQQGISFVQLSQAVRASRQSS